MAYFIYGIPPDKQIEKDDIVEINGVEHVIERIYGSVIPNKRFVEITLRNNITGEHTLINIPLKRHQRKISLEWQVICNNNQS